VTIQDLGSLLPTLILAATALAVLLGIVLRRSRAVAATISLAGLAAAVAATPLSGLSAPHQVGPLLISDAFGLFFVGLLSAAGLGVGAISWGHAEGEGREEYYALLPLATLGAAVLALSRHFAALFLGLEILSVSLYAMIAYPRRGRRPLEAGLKYLILNSLSSAFLLFGIALVYAASGTLEFGSAMRQSGESMRWGWAGFSLIAIGVGFKLALVPFHMWSPDVYQGAPILTTAFLATVSKGAIWAVLLRFVLAEAPTSDGTFIVVAVGVAVISMSAGNILALLQGNLRRLLAYSSVAHAGYFLAMLPGGGPAAVRAVAYYLVAYIVTTLGAFGVMATLSSRGTELDDLESYRGLFQRHPWRAVLLTAFLLSLAGLPLTAGFLGKLHVIAAGVRSALWVPVLAFIANSALALFYYLRASVVLYLNPDSSRLKESARAFPGAVMALALLAGLVVLLGVYPSPLERVIEQAVGHTRTK
jgi:NADH-quinone oxidoreductase subunit N